ncbi:hypothetical protein SAMN05421810_103481 [Amycolatopsis arida]|uniref:Uncharacterized protein n=1 Tax=Amycolatopsis arida TaxID=587909 RepID=A0A1I5TCY1_9PSEU|nr:hypothetical protein [Amycolatopsis arida]TDX96140.1 hypothetical protein CLV69_103276 [Amycolatopsis arida]SFP80905.1 hypothetical protein SAMN05421810_103481 [Amycolatopsis arida]
MPDPSTDLLDELERLRRGRHAADIRRLAGPRLRPRDIKPSDIKQDIAGLASASRAVVGGAFRMPRADGVTSTGRRKVTVHRPGDWPPNRARSASVGSWTNG